MRSHAVLVLLAGCGRVNFGYPLVPCDEVVSLESTLGDNDHCYTRHDGPVAQSSAKAACYSLGGHLVSLASEAEQDDVLRLSLTGPTRTSLATGGALEFGWEGGEPLAFTAWAPGYPMYYQGMNSNGLLDPDGSWTTVESGQAAPFACEILPWLEFEGHGYRISWAGGPWLLAKNACEDFGGHLATITSAEERLAIASLGPDGAWLGMSITGGVQSWVTGEAVGYTAWADSQPNETIDSCVVLSSAQEWLDSACSQSLTALCERE